MIVSIFVYSDTMETVSVLLCYLLTLLSTTTVSLIRAVRQFWQNILQSTHIRKALIVLDRQPSQNTSVLAPQRVLQQVHSTMSVRSTQVTPHRPVMEIVMVLVLLLGSSLAV